MSTEQSVGPGKSFSAYHVGKVVKAVSARVESKVTQPPERYTQDTLLDAMLAAYRFATSEKDREVLRQTEGLGTSRTRVQIIQNLISRGFFTSTKKGKRHELVSTDFARQLIGALPKMLTDVAMTAKWEIAFGLVEAGKLDWRQVVDHNYQFVDQVVHIAKSQIGTLKPFAPGGKDRR